MGKNNSQTQFCTLRPTLLKRILLQGGVAFSFHFLCRKKRHLPNILLIFCCSQTRQQISWQSYKGKFVLKQTFLIGVVLQFRTQLCHIDNFIIQCVSGIQLSLICLWWFDFMLKPIFDTAPAASKNEAHVKSGQN